MTTRDVTIDLKARTAQYERAMRGAVSSTAGLSSSLGGLGKIGVAAGGAAALGIAAVGAAAIKVGVQSATAFGEFEQSMARIEGLVGVPRAELQGMTEDLKGLAVETARGPQELADALFFITSAGLEGADAMEALEVSAKAATAGLGDTATIADVVTSAVNAYGDSLGGASVATDVLVATVREGKAEAPALAQSLGRVIPIASQMGITFDQVGAAVAAMTRTGLDANEAATALRGVMNSLLAPSTQAEEALSAVGLSAEYLRDTIRNRGLLAGLQEIQAGFEGNDEAITAVFGNVRALTGVLSLLGANASATEEIFGELSQATGSLDTAFGVAADTGAFAFEQAKARIETALLDVGEQILPKLADALNEIAPSLPGIVEGLGEMAVSLVDLAMVLTPALTDAIQFAAGSFEGFQKGLLEGQRSIADTVDAMDVLLGPWINFGETFDETERQMLAWIDTQQAVRRALEQGIDPAHIWLQAVGQMQDELFFTEDRLNRLNGMLGLNDAEIARVAERYLTAGEASGRYAYELYEVEQATGASREALDEMLARGDADERAFWAKADAARAAGNAVDDSIGAYEAILTPLDEVRASLEAAAAAQRSLADAMKELTDPTFKAAKSVGRLQTAQAQLEEAQADGESTAQDLAAAQLAVVEATLEAQSALDGVSAQSLEASIMTVQSVLGGTREEALELLRVLGVLDGTEISTVIDIGLTGAGKDLVTGRKFTTSTGAVIEARAMGGPVTAGSPYLLGEEGPELFVPNRSGTIISNTDLRKMGDKRIELNVYGSARPAEDAETLLLLANLGGI